jgi:hypothetical protein
MTKPTCRAVDRINHAYGNTALKPAMPALLLGSSRQALAYRAQITWKTHLPSSRKSVEGAQIQAEAAQIHDAKTMLTRSNYLNLGGSPARRVHPRADLTITRYF